MHAGQGTTAGQQQSSQHGSVFSFLSPQICTSTSKIGALTPRLLVVRMGLWGSFFFSRERSSQSKGDGLQGNWMGKFCGANNDTLMSL